jgi:hypothetical protein
VEKSIKDSANQFVSEIRAKEKQLIDDLHEVYGAEVMDYVTKRSDMQNNVDSLKSTCSLTELVLKGKNLCTIYFMKIIYELFFLSPDFADKLISGVFYGFFHCLNDIVTFR